MMRRREIVVFEGPSGEAAFEERKRAVSEGRRPSFVRVRHVAPGGGEMPGIHVRTTPYGEEARVVCEASALRRTWGGPIDEMVLETLQSVWLSKVTPETLVRLPEGTAPDGAWLRTEEGWRRKGRSGVRQTLPERVLVIGAGLAGAFVTEALAERGVSVTVLDAGLTPGAGASALCCGLFHPHRQAAENPLFALTRAGYEAMVPILARYPDCGERTGVLDVARDDETWREWEASYRDARPFAMPPEFARLVSREEAAALSGVDVRRGGWWYEEAGVVRVGRLVRRILAESRALVIGQTAVRLNPCGIGWRAVTKDGTVVAEAPTVVICAARNSAETAGLSATVLPIDALYGRISLIANDPFPGLRCAVTGHGYLGKLDGFCGIGATYERGAARVLTNEAAHEHNLSTFSSVVAAEEMPYAVGFYEGVRAVAPDRLPIVGPAPDETAMRGLVFRGAPEFDRIPAMSNLWLCTAMGSRGITWGRLCARTLVRQMAGEAPLLPDALLRALSPLRFAAKAYRESRGQTIV